MVVAARNAWLPHAVLIAGLLLVLFPIYVAFVASTHDLPDILDVPMTLVPGTRLFANFAEALTAGTAKTSGQAVGAMLWNSLVMALAIAIGKIAISLPSAYAVVFFRFPLRKLCFWAIFRDADAAGRGPHHPDLQDHRRPVADRQPGRADPAADRLRDRDLAVPPVFPDDPRRAGRGRQDRRCRAVAVSVRHGHSAVAHQYRGACS